MIEIKFRAFVLEKMYEVKKLIWEERLYIITSGGFIDQGDKNTFLMQYTGFKDRNNKEIYEGDILQWYLTDETTPNGIHVVKWEEFNCGHNGYFTGYGLINDVTNIMQIIGNIYENPELLKE